MGEDMRPREGKMTDPRSHSKNTEELGFNSLYH